MGYSKWLGAGAGWIFGGPIGAIVGFVFGSIYDNLKENVTVDGHYKTRQGDFIFSLLVLTAAVMKADERVLKSELNYVKNFFKHNFGREKAKEYISLLGKIIKQEFDIGPVAKQIRDNMDYPSRVQLLQFLFEIAKSDGKVHPRELEIIKRISRYLGIPASEYESVKAMFYEEVSVSYAILGVPETATNEEVRKAYLKKVKENHPDKVAHLGEEIQRAANERLQKINEAWEKIKKERGI